MIVQQESFQVRVSAGVAHYPADGTEPRQLLENVDIALNRAKEEGRNTVRHYSEEFDLGVLQYRFRLLHDLNNALNRRKGNCCFRLITRSSISGRGGWTGAEALIRWWRPDDSREGGSLCAAHRVYIPVAEQSGLIVSIGEFVLRTACMTNKMWQDRGLPPFRIAVNVSGVQVHRGNLTGQLTRVLSETGLEARWLELEVTESVFMENTKTTIDIINQLRQQGIELGRWMISAPVIPP